MTESEYADYRLRVISRANGRAIHRINSLLGVVLNADSNARYWGAVGDNEKQNENLKLRDTAMADIAESNSPSSPSRKK